MAASERIKRNILDDDLWSDEDDQLLLDAYVASTDVNCLTNFQLHQPDSSNDQIHKTNSNETADESDKTTSHEPVPLQKYRGKYLWVSDLISQLWCEQKMVYSFTVPIFMEENPVMTAGSSLHLARELAVHDVVEVTVTSKEDSFAVKLINLLIGISGFLNGVNIAREVPIFGAPFGEDVFLSGVIDELRFDPTSYTIDLSELKTRSIKSLPKESQQIQHKLQSMIYKKLFDDLVKGMLSKETVAKHLKLSLEKPFGEVICKQLDCKLLTSKNLNELFDLVFTRIQAMTCINQLSIEYIYQETNETLFHKQVFYDDDELRNLFVELMRFWKGKRKPVGVDIEDSWKCQSCEFADICEWRARKAKEYSMKRDNKTFITHGSEDQK